MRTQGVETLASADSLRNLARWALRGRGPLTSNLGEAVAFVRSRDGLPAPDLELVLAPVLFEDEGLTQPTEHGLTLAVVLLKPRSAGTVRLRSADPRVLPAIDPRYLTDPEGQDEATLLRGLRLARRVLAQEPLAALLDGEILPGEHARSDDDLRAHLRALSQTLYHPAGTCRMGSDAGSVVDPRLRVRGIDGLSVADASGDAHAPARSHELADRDDRRARRGLSRRRLLAQRRGGCGTNRADTTCASSISRTHALATGASSGPSSGTPDAATSRTTS